jgi:phosphoserine phosphatase RsbU/P
VQVESESRLARPLRRGIRSKALYDVSLPATGNAGAPPVSLTESHDESGIAARALVQHIFPTRFHKMSGIETALTYAIPGAGNQVGGDIVDAFALANGSATFTIADITGKGAAAAVNAALVKYATRAYASEGFHPEKVLRSLNRLYMENNAHERSESYLTAFFGLVDPARRVLTYASAGHEPAIVCHPGQPPLVLPPTAPMIALCNDDELPFSQATIPLQAGTVLVLTTDGVTEMRSPTGEPFGIDRLRDCACKHVHRSVEQQAERLLREALRFGRGRCDDDIAIMVTWFL